MADPVSSVEVLLKDPNAMGREALREALTVAAEHTGWVSGRVARFIRALDALPPDPSDPSKDTAGQVGRDQNLDAGQARRKTKTAKQLEDLPETQAALEEGEITEAHADALADARSKADASARAALGTHEAQLLAAGAKETPGEFRDRLERFVKRHSADDGRSELERKRSRRRLSLWEDKDGMTQHRGTFDPVSSQVIRSTLDRVAEELYRRDHQHHPAGEPVPFGERDNEQRYADALVEVCKRAGQVTGPAKNQARAVVMLSYEDLVDRLNECGIASTLADGTPIPASVARRLACDAGIIPMVLNGASIPLDLGRSKRFATPGQILALEAQWSTCAIADCTIPFDWCEIHHIVPFNEDGHHGPTDLANLVPACEHGHDLAHTPGWTIAKLDDGLVVTTAPDGTRWERWPNGPGTKRSAEPPPAAASDPDREPRFGAPEPAADLFSCAA